MDEPKNADPLVVPCPLCGAEMRVIAFITDPPTTINTALRTMTRLRPSLVGSAYLGGV